MNEKELSLGLRQLIGRGEIELKMTDEMVDCLLNQHRPEPNDRLDRRKARLMEQIQNDAIEKGRAVVGAKILPFGRYIEAIRAEATLTRLEIARRLHKDEAFVSRIERGDVHPTALPPSDIADMLVLFRVTISQASATMNVSADVNATKHGLKAAARSHGGLRHDQRGEDTERALDVIAARLHQKKAGKPSGAPSANTVVQDFIEKLIEELRRKGRLDLLI